MIIEIVQPYQLNYATLLFELHLSLSLQQYFTKGEDNYLIVTKQFFSFVSYIFSWFK